MDSNGERSDDQGTTVVNGSDIESQQKKTLVAEIYGHFQKQEKNRKIILVASIICLLMTIFIIGWYYGVQYGFNYAITLKEPCSCLFK
jgi:uncharacterized membrane protein